MFECGLVLDTPMFDALRVNDFTVGWDVEVKEACKGKHLEIGFKGFHTPNIQLVYAHYSTAFMLQGFSPKRCVIVAFMDTEGIVNYRNQKFAPNELVILRHPEEIDIVLSHRNDCYSFAIEEEFFYTNFLAYFKKDFDEVVKKRHIYIDPAYRVEFRSFCKFWSSYFLHSDKTTLLLNAYDKIEQKIIESLFGFFQIEGEKKNRTNQTLKLARELLEAKVTEEIKLVEVSKILGISQRTLEYTFKNNLGMSSKRYLQLLRLNAIRKELLVAEPTKTRVSDVALKYGFFHMGHFGSEYKKLFGQTPKETLYKNKI